MKRRLFSLTLILALVGTFVFGASRTEAAARNVGGAAGLVAAVVQIAADDVVDVNVVDSFNNLRVLNNVLNNSPILSNNDVDITVGDVSILSDFLNENEITLEDFLNENNVLLNDVVAIGLLSTGDIIIFV
jgi:hypothetical protein